MRETLPIQASIVSKYSLHIGLSISPVHIPQEMSLSAQPSDLAFQLDESNADSQNTASIMSLGDVGICVDNARPRIPPWPRKLVDLPRSLAGELMRGLVCGDGAGKYREADFGPCYPAIIRS